MQIRIRKPSTRFLIATVTFGLGVLVTMLWVVPRSPVKEQRLRVEIPDSPWEPAFFEQLEERTNTVNLRSLRTVVLPENDLEVRFWYDRFENNQWSCNPANGATLVRELDLSKGRSSTILGENGDAGPAKIRLGNFFGRTWSTPEY